MRPMLRKIVKGALWVVGVVLVIAAVFLFRLVHVGQPDKAGSVAFVGFVPLPGSALLSILDYVTIADQRLFVTDESTGNVYKVALNGNKLPRASDVSVYSGEPATHGVALNPAKTVAYVTRSELNVVDVFDPGHLKALARIPVSDDPDAVLFDSMHDLVYVANGDAHLATLIDPQTHAVIATIALGGKPEFPALDRQTGLIYQNLRDIHSVAAVDVTARSVRERWDLAGCIEPSGMALDDANRRLFIACAGSASVVVFDLNTHRVTTSVAVGPGPDAIAFDPQLHRLYAAGKAGVLTVVHQDGPDALKVLDSIKLHYGAHTLGVDPDTHNLYVAYASLIVPPRLAVFEPLQ
jgi:YVTN family beta-propeller protein